MKKNRLLLPVLLGLMFPLNSQAQWIQSLSIAPLNPSTTDTLYVYANCDFSSGNCNDKSQSVFINPPYIYTSALHCLGVATFICNETDTFKINPLQAGTYTLIFEVNAGIGTTPCTPGIVPGETDSITFQVTEITGTANETEGPNNLSVIPGSKAGYFLIQNTHKFLTGKPGKIAVYNVSAVKVYERNITSSNEEINLSTLGAGIYFIEITGSEINKKSFKINILY